MSVRSKHFFLVLAVFCSFDCILTSKACSQALQRPVTFNANREPLASVLERLGKAGNFYFSYSGKAIRKDSLVSVTAERDPVGVVVKRLLGDGYQIEEKGNYVIITNALKRLSLNNTDLTTDGNLYSVSGIVMDPDNGERLMNASVYEKHRLAATLTDEHGYFRLKFRVADTTIISLTAGKLGYRDTTTNLLHPVSVGFRSDRTTYKNFRSKGNRVESNGFGRLLISARQKIQSLNIPDFLANSPYQISLTPGLSSHGMLSSHVINRFSLNLIGGYTAGVAGAEFGGLFNINKEDARYLQAAGIFNLVGGSVRGAQVAGVHNFAIDTVKGIQMAGFINQSSGPVSGLQISSLHNEARLLKGVQIGLVNQADTSRGASLGLLNLIGNGFYRVTVSSNDLTNTNLSIKSGTHAFYTILMAGLNISTHSRMSAFGLGAGHDFVLNKAAFLSAEANYQFANAGLWDDRWVQGKLLFNFQLTNHISLMAGPTFNHYKHSGSSHISGYSNVTNIPEFPEQAASPYQTRNWLGWEAGLAFNSVFRSDKPKIDDSYTWYLGIGGSAGAGWSQPFSRAYGGEIFVQRDLGNHLSAVLSAGYTTFPADKNYTYYEFTPPTGNGFGFRAMPYRIIPVKFGIRSVIAGGFYIGGDLGQAWAKQDDGFYVIENGVKRPNSIDAQHVKSFVFSAIAGYDIGNGLDAGFKFENYTGFADVRQFALRMAYKLKLSK